VDNTGDRDPLAVKNEQSYAKEQAMFGRKSPMDARIETLVGPNSTVMGDLAFAGRCHVDGLVKGHVSADADSNSALSISEDGRVEGGVSVPYLVLQGVVRGDVVAGQRVELGPTARVIGNVYYNLIEMAIGAEINGKLVHKPEGPGPQLDQTDRIETRGPTRLEMAEARQFEADAPAAGVKAATGT
jgi:cytoskeletal protein CcmA (bactofilin family)